MKQMIIKMREGFEVFLGAFITCVVLHLIIMHEGVALFAREGISYNLSEWTALVNATDMMLWVTLIGVIVSCVAMIMCGIGLIHAWESEE